MPAYPYVEFALTVGTAVLTGEALVDTGYTGWFIIPASEAVAIDAEFDSGTLQMPDGFVHKVRIWIGELDLGVATLTAEAAALGDEFIVGRRVLNHFEVCLEHGERVTFKNPRV